MAVISTAATAESVLPPILPLALPDEVARFVIVLVGVTWCIGLLFSLGGMYVGHVRQRDAKREGSGAGYSAARARTAPYEIGVVVCVALAVAYAVYMGVRVVTS